VPGVGPAGPVSRVLGGLAGLLLLYLAPITIAIGAGALALAAGLAGLHRRRAALTVTEDSTGRTTS
jgi:hypothetical protein